MASSESQILNFNVGILGHVDSGKTTLARAISTVASTAAFDKNPQSKERGITLDLGFSSFCSASGDHIKELYAQTQYTLVDCPGHASLIKTIIGGAQIIDLMILVVDITKGIQTQTAECLVIGEITCSRMIVALNKIDSIAADKREKAIEKMTKRMTVTLASTRFKDAPIVAVSAKPSGDDMVQSNGIDNLVSTLKNMTYLPSRKGDGAFVFNVDHCFAIRGQGTVMTGTILQGSVSVNDSVEVSALKENRKVKSIQMFRKPVSKAKQGDRIGLCVTQFEASQMERGLVATPGYLPTVFGAVITLKRISYFKGDITSKAKFHISIGHETVLAKLTLFGCSTTPTDMMEPPNLSNKVEEICTSMNNIELERKGAASFNFEDEYKIVQCISGDAEDEGTKHGADKAAFGLLEFERPVVIVPGCKVLGSKLDSDIHKNICRLAFDGTLIHSFKDREYQSTQLSKLKVFKVKQKQGTVERLVNDYEVVCKNMFKKETNIHLFSGLTVTLSTGEQGVIDGPFGQSGKFKVRLKDKITEEAESILSSSKKKKTGDSTTTTKPGAVNLLLDFKRYVFDKRMVQ